VGRAGSLEASLALLARGRGSGARHFKRKRS